MLTLLNELIKDKKVLILGFGREGKSTLRLLLQTNTCKSLTIADFAEISDTLPKDVTVISGSGYQDSLDNYDLVIKSPGVVLNKDEKDYRCRITSQTELFFQRFSRQIVGITGTKGKSTTASLLYHVLKENGVKTVMVGNIGIPAFDRADKIEKDTVVVFELSSHQLEYTKLSPHISVLLNLYEEHLDHYGSFEKYAAAKKNIYKHQNAEDLFFCNIRNLPSEGEHSGKVISLSEQGEPADICIEGNHIVYQNHRLTVPTGDIKLLGHHNLSNIAVAFAISLLFGLTEKTFLKSLLSYQPLPHRLQFVGEKDGILFYDDSISTICETTIQALVSIPETDTVLIGGMDRGIDYLPLATFLSDFDIPHIILMAETGKRIFKLFQEKYPACIKTKKVQLVDTLEEAVLLSKKITAKGKAVLLSPAAASYGIYKNFEERGEVFQRLVRTL